MEFDLRVAAQDEDYPAIAEVAVAVVEDDLSGFGHEDSFSLITFLCKDADKDSRGNPWQKSRKGRELIFY